MNTPSPADAILFLHGFLGRGAQWEEMVAPLRERWYVLTPDLPGHGTNLHNDLNTPLTFDQVTDEILHFMDTRNLRHIILVGYSLGGRLALHVACRFPQRVTALVLESTSPGIPDATERARRLEEDRHRATAILQQGMRSFVQHWYQQPLFASLQRHPALLRELKHAAAQNDPHWMAKVIYDLSPGQQIPLWDCLPRLAIPTLLIAGEQDPKYTTLMTQMATRLPHARLVIAPQAGHNVHVEQAEWFRAVLLEYLLQNHPQPK
ncbi:MAG: 2-succinyl-6-hydroxy-2,4-cyclohexadiene-1-carboxylate synthase [Anaerolineae bacterium]